MRFFSRIIRNLTRGTALDRELDEELRSCVEILTTEKLQEGFSPKEARRRALLEVGGIEQAKERVREGRSGVALETFWRDLRLAFRGMRRQPGFAAVAGLTLGLGLGANIAIFSLIDAVIYRPLPVEQPEQLVLFDRHNPQPGKGAAHLFSPDLERRLTDGLDGCTVFAFGRAEQVVLQVGAEHDLGVAQFVSPSYFSALRVRTATGRLPHAAERPDGHGLRAVISLPFAERLFGDPLAALGKVLSVAGNTYEIIGVTPAGFFGASLDHAPDLWLPLEAAALDASRPALTVMARLAPETHTEHAAAQATAVLHGWLADRGQPDTAQSVTAAPAGRGLSSLRARFGRPLFVLMLLVSLVLLVACANVASLFLARLTARRREIATRLALGAGRARVFSQVLLESVPVALTGGVAGIGLALGVGRLLVRMISADATPLPLTLGLDARTLLFAAAASVLAGTAVGLLPAWIATRRSAATNPNASTDATRGSNGLAYRSHKALIVAQVAVSFLLLVSAGLLARSLVKLESVNADIRRDRVLLVTADPRLAGRERDRIGPLLTRIRGELAALPGVASVAMGRASLLSGGASAVPLFGEGNVPVEGEDAWVDSDYVSPDYFATLGLAFVDGRDFGAIDLRPEAGLVAIVNATAEAQLFDGGAAVGKHLGYRTREGAAFPFEVIGVVEDAKYRSLREEPRAMVYLLFDQQPSSWSYTTFHVRTTGSPRDAVSSVLSRIRTVDAGLPIYGIKTLAEQRDESLVQERLIATLSSLFGVLALLISCVGLYGVMSYAVASRTRELGVRSALGATRGALLRSVLLDTLRLVAFGLVIGVPTAFAATRLLSGLLFGVTAQDPATHVLGLTLMIAVAIVAGYLPATRAGRIDPLVALRHE